MRVQRLQLRVQIVHQSMGPRLLDELQQIRNLAAVKPSYERVQGRCRNSGERKELLGLIKMHMSQNNQPGDASIKI
jgi:hypothetical protein